MHGRALVFNLALLGLACQAAHEGNEPGEITGRSREGDFSLTGVAGMRDAARASVQSLRFEVPDETVLVWRGGEPFLTAGSYHRWLDSYPYPLGIQTEDTVGARRETLEKRVGLLLILEKAAENGFVKTGPEDPADESARGWDFARRYVANPVLVSDREARDYVSAGAGGSERAVAEPVPDGIDLTQVKLRILSERFQDQVSRWREEASLRYYEETP